MWQQQLVLRNMCGPVQIVVIPVLIGLLFELLVVVPLRVPIDESPVFLLYQDWALGLVFLKIWTRLVSDIFLVQSLFPGCFISDASRYVGLASMVTACI